MNKIDNYICDGFQRLSDWLQDLTGKTCFWYAAVCLMGTLFSDALRYSRRELDMVRFTELVVCLLVIMFTSEFLKSIYMPKGEFMNPLRINNLACLMRTLLLCIFLAMFMGSIIFGRYSWGLILIMTSFSLFTCSVYFASCTPRPGSKSKLGKFIDSLARRIFGRSLPQST